MTFYVRRGQGEPLLLVQGMGGHHQFWGDWFLDLLEPHFDVVAYDHRGIGKSPWADSQFTIADLADDAASLIRSLGWSSAHVFGISLGGMVVQELTLRHPSLVKTLTIGCSWAGGPMGELSQTVRRILEAQATRNVDHALRTGYEGNLSRSFAADPAHYELYAALAMAVRVPLPVIMMQWEAAQQHNTTARLPAITTPTLVLHGTADVNMAVHNGKHIASLIPDARLELLEGAGHLFWWEQPERTTELLLEHALGERTI